MAIDRKYRLCDVAVGETTKSCWIPFRRAQVKQFIHVKKAEAVLTPGHERARNPANWDVGTITLVGEAKRASELTDEQKLQVLEE